MSGRMLSMSLIAVLTCLIMVVAVRTMQGADAPPAVQKAVHWASTDGKTEVLLIAGEHEKLQLEVISAANLKVSYHTSVNSSRDVDQTLTPLPSVIRNVKRYDVPHRFSRTTIWMRLEFTRNGKPVDELTRTFYNSIEESVPNEQFRRGRGK